MAPCALIHFQWWNLEKFEHLCQRAKITFEEDCGGYSGAQHFWQHEPVSWKTIFPWTGLGGWFWSDSRALDLSCTLFLLSLHQLHLRSPGLRSQRLGTPGLEDLIVNCVRGGGILSS